MITQFKIFELNLEHDDLTMECNRRIIEIIRKSGYIVHYHARIYQSTVLEKNNLISTTYNSFEEKYGEIVYLDAYSFFKNNFDPINYSDNYFIYPIKYVQKLKDDDVINYKKLPFFDDLFEVLSYYNKQKIIKKFKI